MKIYTDKDPNHELLNELCKAVADAQKVSQYATLLLTDILDYLPHQVLLGTPVLKYEMGLVIDCVCQLRYDKHIRFNSYQAIQPTESFHILCRPVKPVRPFGYSFQTLTLLSQNA